MTLKELGSTICDTLHANYGPVRVGDKVNVYRQSGHVQKIEHGEAIIATDSSVVIHARLDTLNRSRFNKTWRRK